MTYHRTFTTTPATDPVEDIQNTVTHELGHVAGFDHNPGDPESTMFPGVAMGGTKKRDLTADDAQGLCDVYPVGQEPEDSSGGCCSTGGGAGAPWLAAIVLLALRRSRQCV